MDKMGEFILMHCEIRAKLGGKLAHKRPRPNYNTGEVASGQSRLRAADVKIPLKN